MNFAKVIHGKVVRYPYTLAMLRRDDPEGDYPDDFDLATVEGVEPVNEGEKPEPREHQIVDWRGPELIEGQWTVVWFLRDWIDIAPDGLYARIDGDNVAYPYTLWDLRRDFPEMSARDGGLRQIDGEWGVVQVEAVEAPAVSPEQVAENLPDGAGIEESGPGQWRQVWTVRDRTEDEFAQAKVDKREAVDARLALAFAAGFTPATGPLAGKTLQTRNMEDRTNWLTSQAAYSAEVAAGQGSDEGAVFRTADNQTIVTTYQNGLLTLLAMAAWGKALMGHSWALKDDIAAAATFAELAAIDIDEGWPA